MDVHARRGRLRRLAFHVVAVACVLAVLEAGARLVSPESEGERQTAEFLDRSLGYLKPCAVVEERDGRRMLIGQLPQNTGGDFRFLLEKSDGVTRVAFVGESTGVMVAGPAADLVAQAGASESFQVMDCADGGSALPHVERRAAEVLDYAPDALVVVFGHNWMMPRYPMDATALRLRRWLSSSRLLGRLAGGLTGPFPEPPPVDGEQRVRRLAELERFLRRLASESKRRSIALVLTTLVPNLWFPPTTGDDVVRDDRFLDASMIYALGRRRAGIDALGALVEERPRAYWHFTLGTWLSREGFGERAARHLQAGVDLADRNVDRATSEVNDLIRRVAREEHVVLVDADARLRDVARDRAPGWDLLRDPCHLQPRYLREEAIRLLESAVAAAGKPAPPDLHAIRWNDDDVLAYMMAGLVTIQAQLGGDQSRRFREGVSYLVEHWARAAPESTLETIDRFLGSDALTTLPMSGRAAVRVRIAAGLHAAGLHERARTLNRLALEDGGAEALVQLGLFEAADGDLESASDAFARALEVEPGRPDAVRFLQALEASSTSAADGAVKGASRPRSRARGEGTRRSS